MAQAKLTHVTIYTPMGVMHFHLGDLANSGRSMTSKVTAIISPMNETNDVVIEFEDRSLRVFHGMPFELYGEEDEDEAI